MATIREILFHFSMAILCAGGVLAVLVGAGMLLKPERIVSLTQYFSRWISPAEKVTEQLDRPRWIERNFYRHHRLAGGVLFFGSIFVLYMFLFNYNVRKLSSMIPRAYLGLYDALFALLLGGSVLAALVGIIVLTRPSLLRDIEKATNRWINTEPVVKTSNKMHYSVDQHILRHRKIAGVVMVIGGLYILINLAPFLWRTTLKF